MPDGNFKELHGSERQQRLQDAGDVYAAIMNAGNTSKIPDELKPDPLEDYLAAPDFQANLDRLQEQMSVGETVEHPLVGIENPEDRLLIQESAEDNILSQLYSYNPETLEVVYKYEPKVFLESDLATRLDALQKLLNEVSVRQGAGEQLPENIVDHVQRLYDATKAGEAFPEAIETRPSGDESLLVDSPNSPFNGARTDDEQPSYPAAESAQRSHQSEPSPAEQPTEPAAEAEVETEAEPDQAETEAESADVVERVDVVQEQTSEYMPVSVFGMNIPQPGVTGTFAVSSFRQALGIQQEAYRDQPDVSRTIYQMLLLLQSVENGALTASQHDELIQLTTALPDTIVTYEYKELAADSDSSQAEDVVSSTTAETETQPANSVEQSTAETESFTVHEMIMAGNHLLVDLEAEAGYAPDLVAEATALHQELRVALKARTVPGGDTPETQQTAADTLSKLRVLRGNAAARAAAEQQTRGAIPPPPNPYVLDPGLKDKRWEQLVAKTESLVNYQESDEVAIETTAEVDEVVDFVVLEAELKDQLYNQVDRVAYRSPQEREVAHALFSQYEVASDEDKLAAAEKLQQYLGVLDSALIAPETVLFEAGTALADFEIEVGSSHLPEVQHARQLHQEITDIFAAPPTEADELDQLVAERHWHYELRQRLRQLKRYADLKEGYAAGMSDDGLGNVNAFKSQPKLAEARRAELVSEEMQKSAEQYQAWAEAPSNRSRVLEPENLDATTEGESGESVPISVSSESADETATPDTTASAAEGTVAGSDDAVELESEEDESTTNTETTRPSVFTDLQPSSRRTLTEREQFQNKVKQTVTQIEKLGMGPLDRTFGRWQSPFYAYRKRQFTDIAQLATLEYSRLKEQLDRSNVKYEVMNQWVQRIPAMMELVPDAERLTFEQVVARYVRAGGEQ